MATRSDPTAPRLARRLLAALLPERSRWAVVDELDAEWRLVRADAGAFRARWWYWRQAIGSIPAAWQMHHRDRTRVRDFASALRVGAMAGDVRLAVRSVLARPGFAAAAILTMAVGIGANVATFSIVDAVVFRPLPYPRAASLVRVWSANPRGILRNALSPPDYFDMRDGAPELDALAAFTQGDAITLGAGEPRRLVGSSVTPDLFDVLEIRPAAGRALLPDDTTPAQPVVVVVSEAFAHREFGSPAAAVSRTIVIDDAPRTIVGVMPATFAFPSRDTEVWLPMPAARRQLSRSAHYLGAVGRLHAGSTIERARESLRAVASRLELDNPGTNKGWSVTVASLQDAVVGDTRRPLLVAFGAVGCVLLVACANVANLLLARGHGRRREFAVRAALGATRAHIFRLQLVESGVIALTGGMVGALGAAWIVGVAGAMLPATLPRLEEIHVNARVLTAALTMSCLAALCSGWVPAWRATRFDSRETLRAQSAPYRARGRRTGGAIVAAEIALTLALLVTASLLVKSLISLRGVDPGFDADRVLLAEVNLSQRRYAPPKWSAVYEQVIDGLSALPGVRAAGAGAPLPLSGQPGLLRFGLVIDGRPPLAAQVDRIYLRWATPGYFTAMGIPVREGRAFLRDDRADSLPVAIVDEAFAARHFPGENALGHRVRPTSDNTWREIVGIVGKVRQTSLDGDAEPHLYVAAAQFPTPVITFVVRGDGDPASLASGVRAVVHGVDPAEPLFNVRTLRDVVSDATTPQRFNASLIALFAGCAGLLTVLGIYSVTSRWVSDSTRELGVRIALGAGHGQILRSIVGRGLRVIAVGVATGLVLAVAAGRLIATLLFGVSQTDPVVFAGATALVVIVTLVATLIPAQRALSVDPAISLRAS